MFVKLFLLAALLVVACAYTPIKLEWLASVGAPDRVLDNDAAEIPAYHNNIVYVSNNAFVRVDLYNISTPTSPFYARSIDLSTYGSGLNSVAYKDGVLIAAVAVSIHLLIFRQSTYG